MLIMVSIITVITLRAVVCLCFVLGSVAVISFTTIVGFVFLCRLSY